MSIAGRTLVLIRERSFFDLLDLALAVVRRRPLAIGLTVVAGALPFVAINAGLLYLLRETIDEVTGNALILWLILLEAPWATAPLTVVMGGLMFGDRPKAGRVVRSLIRSIPHMFLFQGIMRGLFLFTFILAVLFPARLPFLNEVILLEATRPPSRKRAPGAIWSRCSDLTRGHEGEFFLRWFAGQAYGIVFFLVFTIGAWLLARMLFVEPTWELPDEVFLGSWNAQLAIWITINFFGIVRFLSYIDQRIRLEGWEIELRFKGLGAAMEDDDR